MAEGRYRRDPTRPVYVISVAASILEVHPRTLRIYEDEGLVCPARTPTNIRLYSENDIRRVLWIRHLTQDRGVNLAGIRILFELEERLGTRILEALFDEGRAAAGRAAASQAAGDEPESPADREPGDVSAIPEDDPAQSHERPQRREPSPQPRARFTRIVTTRITSRANATGEPDA